MSARIAGFMAHLRLNGVRVGSAETHATVDFLSRADIDQFEDVRQNLKVLLTGRKSEWDRFDDLFEAYWLGRGRTRQSAANPPADAMARSHTASRLWSKQLGPAALRPGLRDAGAEPDAPADGHDTTVRATRLAASNQHALRRADLRHVADPEEIARAEHLAFRLASAMRYRLSRRFRYAPDGQRLDLRRTLRRNLSRGGEPLSLVHRARPDRPVRIVVMLDTSGSMQPYSRFMLQFVKGLVRAWKDTDAYLFHTRLVRITDVLREKDAMQAMRRLTLMAEGFGGGTRMSECLAVFNERYAKRSLNSRSVFLVISDGYDTGDPSEFTIQMERLKRRARRLVWLNPLLGWERYEPVTRTMQAALPFIDHFAPAHSLDALAALEAELGRL